MYLKLSIAGLLLVGALSGPITAGSVPSHRHSMNISGGEHGPVADCAGLHIRLNDRRAEIRSEERTIARPGGALRVESEVNGGVQVQGWDKDTYSVTACKAADASSDNVEQLFSQIKLSVENGRVSVSDPSDHENWTVFLLVRAPKSANLELRANNGPLSIYDLDGKVVARAMDEDRRRIEFGTSPAIIHLSTVNGPISVKQI
jgi:hypothetical protein